MSTTRRLQMKGTRFGYFRQLFLWDWLSLAWVQNLSRVFLICGRSKLALTLSTQWWMGLSRFWLNRRLFSRFSCNSWLYAVFIWLKKDMGIRTTRKFLSVLCSFQSSRLLSRWWHMGWYLRWKCTGVHMGCRRCLNCAKLTSIFHRKRPFPNTIRIDRLVRPLKTFTSFKRQIIAA